MEPSRPSQAIVSRWVQISKESNLVGEERGGLNDWAEDQEAGGRGGLSGEGRVGGGEKDHEGGDLAFPALLNKSDLSLVGANQTMTITMITQITTTMVKTFLKKEVDLDVTELTASRTTL